ncbi:TPA: hypothetical protein KM440_003465 [Clostridioides difficile]|uniref:hypothetical protein n=1 Tax=Clostridioides difficile TaxID=1496 RepID=UPI00163DD335|nr:hypothetical protein [Clostridioides difficile]MBY1305738.1 hypothetical protein [Clostridioides difficile]HBE8726966.1 hypothetical protein [Clostridioides difficile]HBH3622971.1 hypothetical protein [Clostridioides difficile]
MYLFSSKVLTEEVIISKLFLLLELSPMFSAIKIKNSSSPIFYKKLFLVSI